MPHRACHVVAALVAAWLVGVGAMPARADTVFIAPSSHAAFSVRVLWLKHVRGRFDTVYGSVDWSRKRRQGVVHAWIDVASARMDDADTRRRLLGPEFLDATTYPGILFASDPLGLHVLRQGGAVHGRLHMHGMTRPVTFTLQASNCRRPATTPCTLRLHGSVKRSRFGITAHRALVSDRVQLDLVIRLAPAAGAHQIRP